MSGDPAPGFFDEDRVFDRQFPLWMQVKSALHLTPMAVARCAAHLLAPDPGMRVLDVGAGPGKFCLVAAREVPTCTFVGVEIRPHLVTLARKLAASASVPNASFIEGNAMDLDWSEYDAFYFFNPFAEQLHDKAFVLDRTMDVDPARFLDYVMGVRQQLAAARIGTRVVTYHGFGAPAPIDYDLMETHVLGTDQLELWVKNRHLGGHTEEDHTT